MPMRESNLGYAIQMQPNLRNRIEAIVRDRMWDNPNEQNPTRAVPVEHIAWAVVANDEIRATVRAAFSNPEDPNVGKAVEAITDQQLAPVVYAALERLNFDRPVPAPAPQP